MSVLWVILSMYAIVVLYFTSRTFWEYLRSPTEPQYVTFQKSLNYSLFVLIGGKSE